MGTPFKMKGNPMQRNFGIGSPLHDETSTWDKIKSAGKALWAGRHAESSSRSTNLASTISEAYKKSKKGYRDIAKKKN